MKSKSLYHSSIFLLCLSVGVLTRKFDSVLSAEVTDADFLLIRDRYLDWVLVPSSGVDWNNDHVTRHHTERENDGDKAEISLENYITKWEEEANDPPKAAYDTTEPGDDRTEMEDLVTTILPDLAVAYRLESMSSGRADRSVRRTENLIPKIVRVLDRLDERGFDENLVMVDEFDDAITAGTGATAKVFDFSLRTSGYPLSTLLLRDVLDDERFAKCAATSRRIVDQFNGSDPSEKIDSDGIRVVIGNALPYSLAVDDRDGLEFLSRQIVSSTTEESNAEDTIKPDGLVFQRGGALIGSYVGVLQATFATHLFQETDLAFPESTLASLFKSMNTLQIISHKYHPHQALSGRDRNTGIIPRLMLGYGYLAAMDHLSQTDSKKILLRLLDDDQLRDSNEGTQIMFSPFPGEVTPGTGAVNAFFAAKAAADSVGPGPIPEGNWAFNYGPLSVHRRDNWMVTVKGHSKYLWAFERSQTQNVLGFHDGSASIYIHIGDDPVTPLKSGYTNGEGWDWSYIPGTTTRIFDEDDFYELDQDVRAETNQFMNRPFSESPFAGGLSLKDNGMFVMDYCEVLPGQHSMPLRAQKAVFFFDDEIVVLTKDVRGGDDNRVRTALFQSSMINLTATETWVDGEARTGEYHAAFLEGRFNKNMTLVDPMGNGYFVPLSNDYMVVTERESHTFRSYSAEELEEGIFATAQISHGKSPKNESFYYVIRPGVGNEGMKDYNFDKSFEFDRMDSTAVILNHKKLNMKGYVFYVAGVDIPESVIASVSTPSFAMIHHAPFSKGDAEVIWTVSICNPDFGWTEGVQYRRKDDPDIPPSTDPVPMPMSMTMRGNWELVSPLPDVSISNTMNDRTTFELKTSDSRAVEFQIRSDDDNFMVTKQPTPSPTTAAPTNSPTVKKCEDSPTYKFTIMKKGKTKTKKCKWLKRKVNKKGKKGKKAKAKFCSDWMINRSCPCSCSP